MQMVLGLDILIYHSLEENLASLTVIQFSEFGLVITAMTEVVITYMTNLMVTSMASFNFFQFRSDRGCETK